MTTKSPRTAAADSLHAIKYRALNETFQESVYREAFALKDNDAHYHEYKDIRLARRFLPGGRIQSAMGAMRQTTAFNCFVSGTIMDSMVDGEGCIMDRLKEAAATMRMGGGIGYDFSTLRPMGDKCKRIDSNATGPLSFMEWFNAVCLGICSSGHRRGAQMGVMRVDHPDIEAFISAKQVAGTLEGFNISIGITDEFMVAVLEQKEFDLRFNGQVYRTIDAETLWQKIMRSTYDWAEPGVLFLDTVNGMNNLWYAETIVATNPCGEQPLPPYGACLLGSLNLPEYLSLGQDGYYFNFDQMEHDLPTIVRAMDNVVDRTRYPLAAQRAEAVSKRRMGLGVTGLANAAEACGKPYGSEAFIQFEHDVLRRLRDAAYNASADLAKEKGAFPWFDAEKYLNGRFIKTLPDDLRRKISDHGIRNSHLISIAPTGTISMCADNVSSGIEPVFSYQTERTIHTPDGPQVSVLEDYGAAFLMTKGKLAADVTAKEHTDVLIAAQQFTDSAVSKTINMDGSKMAWDDFVGIYTRAWQGGAKGCTTFNISGKKGALLVARPEGESCEIGEGGRRDCQ